MRVRVGEHGLGLNWQVRGRGSALVGASLAGAYTIRPTNAIPLAFGAAAAGIFAALMAVSVFMHGRGALSREAPYWNRRPIDIDYDQDRLWDWRRPPFLAGITFSPSKGARDASRVLCSSPPGAPASLSVLSSDGSTVVLAWEAAPGHATSYTIEAGTAPGLTNQGTRESWAREQPVYKATRVPPGTYFVRVRGKNRCGVGPSSDDVKVVVR